MPDPFKIAKPGIYIDVPTQDYFADPCPAPSLTQSVAKVLIDQSPLHAWHAHPRLNPDYQHDDDRKFDVGNIAHKLMIGRGKDIVVIDFDDWRTKAAKEAREAAAAEGRLAVLGKHYSRAERMVAAAREQIDHRGLADLFRDGDGEAVMAWQENGLWMRQMVDWLSPDRLTFADYKTTDMNAAPHVLGRMMASAGWPIQAAMAERGLTALLPKTPASSAYRRFLFVVQEAEPPYCLNVVDIGHGPIAMGHKMLDRAVELWRACVTAGRWPGYPPEIVTPEYPGWAEQQWLDREIHDAARARVPSTDSVLSAG